MVKQQIVETIAAYDTIIIHRHVRPDPDAIGSQVSLKELIKLKFPHKQVYAVGEEDPAYNFLARMDQVTDGQFKDALVIVTDTANQGRISDKRYILGDKIIKIDHHPPNDQYGFINWVNTEASSTSEMIYEFYLAVKKDGWKMNESIARLIYGGIVGDTGRFLFPSTKNKTFRYAAELIEYPFDRTDLYNGMYDVDQNIARLRGYMLENLHVSEEGVSFVNLKSDVLTKYNVTPIETSKLVGTFGEIKGVRAWVMFIEEENVIRARIRSKGPVINGLASKYRGGGHPLASGATVHSWQEANDLIDDLKALCRE